jgi:hypothetical protein
MRICEPENMSIEQVAYHVREKQWDIRCHTIVQRAWPYNHRMTRLVPVWLTTQVVPESRTFSAVIKMQPTIEALSHDFAYAKC